MTKRQDHEHQNQVALFQWAFLASKHKGGIPELRFLFAIPNAGQRHPAVARKMVAEGLKSGVPDVCLPFVTDNGESPGLFIEMKYGKNKPTREQEKWLKYLKSQCYKTAVCYSWQEAAKVILDYLGREDPLGVVK